MNTIAMKQPHILQQFNQYAIAKRFTGVQTQLWQHLYWLTHTYGQGVCIPTYHLLETMGISRSQLLRARKVLEKAGCLRVEKINAQRLHYTVMLDGELVDCENGGESEGKTVKPKNNRKPSGENKCGTSGSPSPTNAVDESIKNIQKII